MAANTWRDHAACRDTDAERFFPLGTTGAALEQINQAKHLCGGCPVRAQCLNWALETGQDAGIWGGTTEDERRALRRARQRTRTA
jgi:WhiB family redox-sensing transcriptional regulator